MWILSAKLIEEAMNRIIVAASWPSEWWSSGCNVVTMHSMDIALGHCRPLCSNWIDGVSNWAFSYVTSNMPSFTFRGIAFVWTIQSWQHRKKTIELLTENWAKRKQDAEGVFLATIRRRDSFRGLPMLVTFNAHLSSSAASKVYSILKSRNSKSL